MKKIINTNLFLFFAGFATVFTGCSQTNKQTPNVFPGETWEEKTPESQGVDPVILDSALYYFREHSGGVGTDEMIVVKNGFIIRKGPGYQNKHELFSVTKTFTTTVLGVLVKQGKLSVDDLAYKYYPELIKGDKGQEAYKQVRFRDLATMTAGYSAVETNCWSLHMKGLHNESLDCTKKYVIPGKPQYEPRTKWSYRDPNVHILGYILSKIGGKSLEDIFRQEIAEKIDMKNWDWSDYGEKDGILFNNPAGTPNNEKVTEMNDVQGGIWTTPLNFARFGLLYLNKGNWNGEQLLDSTFAKMAISNQVSVELPSIGLDLAGRYGYYWWTNGIRKDGTRPWPSAPPGASTPHGGGRNFCFVIPEWNMVVVRMSPRWESSMSADGAHGDIVWEGFFKILKNGIN
jgi:CubicO group peptidase (beta-lactamase class C family)